MANKNRTLVKLDDTIIEIKEGKKGLEAKRLSEDDLIEITLLDEGIEKFIENDVHKLADEAYAELQQSFKNTLKANVLKIVGFDDKWGKWEIDHCNGRASVLTEYMSHKIQTMFRTEIDALMQPEIEQMLKPLKKQMIAEFKSEFIREVRSEIRQSAQKAASSFLSDVMSKQVQKFQKQAIEKAELAFLGRKSTPTDDDDFIK